MLFIFIMYFLHSEKLHSIKINEGQQSGVINLIKWRHLFKKVTLCKYDFESVLEGNEKFLSDKFHLYWK